MAHHPCSLEPTGEEAWENYPLQLQAALAAPFLPCRQPFFSHGWIHDNVEARLDTRRTCLRGCASRMCNNKTNQTFLQDRGQSSPTAAKGASILCPSIYLLHTRPSTCFMLFVAGAPSLRFFSFNNQPSALLLVSRLLLQCMCCISALLSLTVIAMACMGEVRLFSCPLPHFVNLLRSHQYAQSLHACSPFFLGHQWP
eukprot:scaffold80774_cov21-Tisochrysis_lutea.AAC.1